MELSSLKIRKFLILYGLSPQIFSQRNFLHFFLKKPALKKFLIFSQKKNFSNFQKTELFCILGKVYSKPWHI